MTLTLFVDDKATVVVKGEIDESVPTKRWWINGRRRIMRIKLRCWSLKQKRK